MKFTTFHLITALSRKAVTWLWDPRIRAHVLESRAGKLYRAYFDGRGWWLNPHRSVARCAVERPESVSGAFSGVESSRANLKPQNRLQELCPTV